MLLGINAETTGDVEKAQMLSRGKYLATVFLLSSDRRQYGGLIFSLKNYYAKQQRNYSRTLTDMYRLMVAFEPTRETPVDGGGGNKGLNFGNVVTYSKVTVNGYHGGSGDTGRKLECWKFVGGNLKSKCPKRSKEK